MAEIIDALEGPVAITECSSGTGACSLESICGVGHAWQKINIGIRRALADVSLADLQLEANPLRSAPNLRRAVLGSACHVTDGERPR
jgi:DNA-binding IscR family transcriptional regulator